MVICFGEAEIIKKYIYADNAASSKLSRAASYAMIPLLSDCYANPSQPYSLSQAARNRLEDARNTIADCINCEPCEIIFTSGGSESNNQVIRGIVSDKKRILVGCTEHKSVLISALAMTETNYSTGTISCDNNGIITPSGLSSLLSPDTALVSVMTVNNETGAIQPIKELAALAQKSGALFHTDAVQAVGHMPVDVKDSGVDFLSASAHKFGGPHGAGFLYIKKGVKIRPLIFGGAQENGLRAGTEAVALIAGMAAALQDCKKNYKNNSAKILKTENALLSELKSHGLDFIRNSQSCANAGILSISFRNGDGEMLLHRLDLMGICVATGAACDSEKTQLSHVLSAMNIPREYAEGTIRISFSADNTTEEAVAIARAINTILKENNK